MNRPWKHKLYLSDVFHSDEMSLEERRDVIVGRIKAQPWYTKATAESADDDTLWWIVDELADTDTETNFDQVWDSFYDWCDDNRVWIETIVKQSTPLSAND